MIVKVDMDILEPPHDRFGAVLLRPCEPFLDVVGRENGLTAHVPEAVSAQMDRIRHGSLTRLHPRPPHQHGESYFVVPTRIIDHLVQQGAKAVDFCSSQNARTTNWPRGLLLGKQAAHSAQATIHQTCDACARHALIEVHLPDDTLLGHAQARGLIGGPSLRHGETSVTLTQLVENADGGDRSSGQTTWYGDLCVATRNCGQSPNSAKDTSRQFTENISQAP